MSDAFACQPQKEHQWLQKLVGEWTYEHECSMGPDQPSSKAQGIERVRSIGGLWTVGEGQGEMPGGQTATTIMTNISVANRNATTNWGIPICSLQLLELPAQPSHLRSYRLQRSHIASG